MAKSADRALFLRLPEATAEALRERCARRGIPMKAYVLAALAETGLPVPGHEPGAAIVPYDLEAVRRALRRALRELDPNH